MLDRIGYVGITCHDLAAKIAFYESVFDLTVASREVNDVGGCWPNWSRPPHGANDS